MMYVSVPQAAKLLFCHRSRVLCWIKEKRLLAIQDRHGRKQWRINLDDVERFIKPDWKRGKK